MAELASRLYAWILAHPLECWGAVSALLNMARHYKWLERVEKTGVGAAVLDFVRAVGIDPAGALKIASLLASTKAASLGANVFIPPSSPPSVLSRDDAPPTPRTGDAP